MKALIPLITSLVCVLTPAAGKTFVLVHGAFEDGSVWTDVKKQLEKNGDQVIVVDLPGRPSHPAGPEGISAEKYRDTIVEAIGERNQVVLVGHSFGGIQISNVAEAIPDRIHALVYVAAYLPKDGESLQGLSAADTNSHVGASFVVSPDYKSASIKESERVNLFCADCSSSIKTH